jgi:predicted metal-dependent phosphoesterase TrpH
VKDSRLKIDLHVHTCYSEDASTTLKEVVYYAKKKGLDGVAITDHGTVKGALKLAKKSQLLIIPGLEVETRHGHILALNIATPVPPNLGMTETVQKIHEIGGTAIIAHPYAAFKVGLRKKAILNSKLDAVEAINSASFPFFIATHLGKKLAQRMKLPQTGGSDAHHGHEIGKAYTLVEADSNADGVVEAIRKREVTPQGAPISWAERMERVAFTVMKPKRRLHSAKFSS